MKKLFSSLCILFSLTFGFSQNSLYPDHLIITDHIQIIDDEDSPIFMNEMMWHNTENFYLLESLDISEMIWDAMIENKITYYGGNALFEQNFPLNLPESNETEPLNELYDVSDSDELRNTPHQINSIIFVENWILDKEIFQLEKEVTGLLPVRHWSRLDDYGEPSSGTKMMMPIAYIPFKTDLSKRQKKKINKRLVPVKKISYEFMLSELHFLGWYDSDISMSMEGIPMVKSFNPLWGNYQAEQLRRVVLDKAFSGNSSVISTVTGEILNDKKLASLFDYTKNENDSFSRNDYTDAGYSWELSFPDIPDYEGLYEQIYSVIFTEEWSIDPETLYIKKKVISITPVFWVNEWNEYEEKTWEKKTLFRLNLN